jgi:hypothetical protein
MILINKRHIGTFNSTILKLNKRKDTEKDCINNKEEVIKYNKEEAEKQHFKKFGNIFSNLLLIIKLLKSLSTLMVLNIILKINLKIKLKINFLKKQSIFFS